MNNMTVQKVVFVLVLFVAGSFVAFLAAGAIAGAATVIHELVGCVLGLIATVLVCTSILVGAIPADTTALMREQLMQQRVTAKNLAILYEAVRMDEPEPAGRHHNVARNL